MIIAQIIFINIDDNIRTAKVKLVEFACMVAAIKAMSACECFSLGYDVGLLRLQYMYHIM